MTVSRQLSMAWRAAARRIDRAEARLLLERASGCSHADLIAHADREMSEAEAECFEALVARREAGEPLAYLLGSAWFAEREFTVTPDVLIPRPDTEVLVDLAVERVQALPCPLVLELGTGSGIIPVTLALRCPQAIVTAVDVSAAALRIAQQNAVRHGASIRFLESDWYASLTGERFNMIVSNPPYIAEGDPHLSRDGLPFEPQQALTDGVAGAEGLACLRTIITGAAQYLLPGGWLLLEHGYDQAVQVRQLLVSAGFSGVSSWQDTAGIERVSGGLLGSVTG